MNQHPNAWPDSPPARRGYVDIEPWELTHQQRQHDAERNASQQWHAQHGTEGCADTGDDEREYASGWAYAAVYGLSAVAVCSALYAIWPYVQGWL